MQEFWFCSQCSSMNRSDSKRCYKCRAAKEGSTLATVAERNKGVVLTPGLDEEHREIAWALMTGNRYVSAWRLGYVSAGLIALSLVLASAIVVDLVAIWLGIGAHAVTPGSSVAENPALSAILLALLIAITAVSLTMVVLHSIFLGLTTMNSPALGCGTARFGPVRSGLWWIESYLWSAWGLQTLWVFPYVVARAFGLLCGPVAAIGKPRRMLQDLMQRFGVPGAADTRVVGFWSMTWAAARVISYFSYLLPVVLLIAAYFVFHVVPLLGIHVVSAPQSQVVFFALILVVLISVGEILAAAAGLVFLAQITLELSRRQRTREVWVRHGLPAAMVSSAGAGAAMDGNQAAYEYVPPEVLTAWFSQPLPWPVAQAAAGVATQTSQRTPPPFQPSPSFQVQPLVVPDEPRFDPRTWAPPRPVWSDENGASVVVSSRSPAQVDVAAEPPSPEVLVPDSAASLDALPLESAPAAETPTRSIIQPSPSGLSGFGESPRPWLDSAPPPPSAPHPPPAPPAPAVNEPKSLPASPSLVGPGTADDLGWGEGL